MDRPTLEAEQQALNRRSRPHWASFAGHRARMTETALGFAPQRPGRPTGRLCVLGAGNCNDLDLAALTTAFAEIHLVDLDGEALAWGLAQQDLAEHATITLHGGCDVTADEPALPPGRFEVMLSACLLSQLVAPVIAELGPDHAALPAALQALRRRHLALLLERLAPGGTALLVSDLVSSDTLPALLDSAPDTPPSTPSSTPSSTPALPLRDLLIQAVEARNFFSGTNPFAILQTLQDDPDLTALLEQSGLLDPWIWALGDTRRYLVYALALRRRP